ncbi:signal recognition particle-docking protein FtsY [bacterium]|jgi:fused signal recognition particle receptor|nr:signal recognition particle-docking protein FtsY [bacterium]MBT5015679.1 signal recognition particle-docking protein FtsY [bacterium]
MFGFIKKTLSKVYTQVTSRLQGLFGKKHIHEQDLQELREILLKADTGVKTTKNIIASLTELADSGRIETGADLKNALAEQLSAILPTTPMPSTQVYVLVGINGSGKTTFASKLAYQLQQQGKKVLLVAADTFRAAAVEQLQQWGERLDIEVVTGKPNGDPAAVVYTASEQFQAGNYDAMIVDTAGRLQTKINLMNELEKIKRIIKRKLPEEKVVTLLTLDSMLGQNSFDQAQIFHEQIDIDGIVLTKMDGTGKGGILFAVASELKLPVWYISFGESVEQLKMFDAQEYIQELLT